MLGRNDATFEPLGEAEPAAGVPSGARRSPICGCMLKTPTRWRLDPLKAILAKLDPPAPRPEPLPPLRPGMAPSRGQAGVQR